MKIKSIEEHITSCIRKALEGLGVSADETVSLGTPPEIDQGDYVFECFPLAKIMRSNPAKIAKEIGERIEPDEILESVAPAGPYLNIRVRPDKMAGAILGDVRDGSDRYGNGLSSHAETITIEYSAPNTNKPMHLGHVRNNTLGAALHKILMAQGHRTHPVNLVNDRGIHICKSMVAYKNWGNGETPESTGMKGDHFVGHYYVLYETKLIAEEQAFLEKILGADWKSKSEDELEAASSQFADQSALMGETKECLRSWEAGDSETIELWSKLNAWVMEGFRQTYSTYGCSFDKIYLESETYRLGRSIVEDGLEADVFERDPDGSVWVDLAAIGLDRKLLLRKDGTSVYITQDMGTAVLRYEDFEFDRSIYVVGNEQDYHFRVLFEVLKILGYEWAKGCFHLSYGMVYLPEGKMKSREGKVVDADDLYDLMDKMARDRIKDHFPDMRDDELGEASRAVALGAIKWYLLRVHPGKDIHFDPEKSIDFEGATGPAIQYAHTRIMSILRKGGHDLTGQDGTDWELGDKISGCLVSSEEQNLLREVRRFPERVRQAAESLNPSIIANAMYDLARGFNRFYVDHPVLRAESPQSSVARLVLIRAVAQTLRNGMGLLGIPMPNRM